ncbi:MAG: ATP-dependent DNA helicase RecG [bacterium]|nr:ATP-dependent DNA helicase RecG [bacterium]
MPSAMETLVKILKLEREQGYKDNAVTQGGLGSYSINWERQALTQGPRKAEHHLMVEEVAHQLRAYAQLQTREERHAAVDYLLNRILNRAPMPESYRARIPEVAARLEAEALTASADAGAKTEERRPREERKRRDDPAARQQDSLPREQQPGSTNAPHERTRGDARPPREERSQNRRERERGTREKRPVIAAPPSAVGDGEAPASLMSPDPKMVTTPAAPLVDSVETTLPRQAEAHPRDERQKERGNKKKDKAKGERRNEPVSRPPRDSETIGGGTMSRDDDFSSLDDVYASARAPVKLDIPVPPKLARPPRHSRPPLAPDEAADLLRGLNASAEKVKSVGPQKVKVLNKVGIVTVKDLLYYLPRRYDDYTRIPYISRLEENQRVTVIGTVAHAEVRIGKGGRRDFFLVISDSSASMGVTFFGQHWLQKQIRPRQQIVLNGETTMFNGRIQMTNPEWEDLDVEDLQNVRVVPIYRLTEGLTNRFMRSAVERALDYWTHRIPDYVPESVLDRTELADLGWALKNLHFPESEDHLYHARRRFIFDELLLLQLAILGNRRQRESLPALSLMLEEEDIAVFAGAVFPYHLTGAQTRAIEDIRRDVARTIPMNRLIQGDVGAGKTAVAVSAIGMALMSGKQSALMAPTSILAEQHYKNISQALEKTPQDVLPFERRPVVRLLTGSLPQDERESVLQGLADGSIDVVIGTHAIIQAGVEFHDLALGIIDEQHRFGVEQRGALRGKGTNPHLLVMTATPIPRTLALTIHADLDLSILDEMPPGRIPVKTFIVPAGRRERAYEWIENELQQGRQAFIVYPLVEESETITEAKAAVQEYDKLKDVFHRYRVCLLHGRMKPAEKDQVMAAFRDHQYDVMVTTSVAEVGVDIPNASVMMIEGANRFGLAQLHQFRGRVGRGGFAAYCLLISDSPEISVMERLKIVRDYADGFKLAEEDFRQRGAGDLIGTQQSGQGSAKLQLAELMTPELVELAQREARTLYEEDPDLALPQHRLLAQRVEMLKDERTDIS